MREMSTLPFEEQQAAATERSGELLPNAAHRDLSPKLLRLSSSAALSTTNEDGSSLIIEFRRQADVCILSLAQNHLPAFLRTSQSDDTVLNVQLFSAFRKALGQPTKALVEDRMWSGYAPPPDVIGWLTSIMDASSRST